MVAQIDPALHQAQQRVADRQGPGHADAGAGHVPPELRADQRPRAEIVDQDPADDAARGGPFEGLDHLAAVGVGQPDIEQQMDVRAGGVDVGHHGVDRRVGVRQQPPAVAADRPEAADGMPEAKQRGVVRRNRALEIVEVEPAVRRRQPGEHLAHAFDPPAPDIHLAEQNVGQHAEHRHRGDDHDPGEAGGGLAVGAQQDPDDQAHLDHDVKDHQGHDGEGTSCRERAVARRPHLRRADYN